MATTTHLVSSIDGKSMTLWPVQAVSRSSDGVFRDIRNRIVPSPADRMGVARDSADGGRPAKRKAVGKDSDSAIDTIVRKLLPTLKRMADEAEAAEGEDGMEEEQAAQFDTAEEKAGIVNVSEQSKTRLQWLAINRKNAERRGLPYSAIVPASREQARKAH